MIAKNSITVTGNDSQATAGKFTLQLARFVPHSHRTMDVEEDGGRIQSADMEQDLSALTVLPSVVTDHSQTNSL